MITIVSGLPRSGTSLMMQMLSAGGLPALTDNQRTPDEDNPRGYLEFEAVKKTKQDPTWLNDATGKVVKMVHLLLMDLPSSHQYRVVFMRRLLDEILASQQKMLQRSGKTGSALPKDQLAKIYQTQVATVLGFVARNPNFKLIEVNYNHLLADPKGEIVKINAFMDRSLDEAKMLLAIDPSLYRNRG